MVYSISFLVLHTKILIVESFVRYYGLSPQRTLLTIFYFVLFCLVFVKGEQICE